MRFTRLVRCGAIAIALAACGSRATPPPSPSPLEVVRAAEPGGPREVETLDAHRSLYVPHAWGVRCADSDAFTWSLDCSRLAHAVVRTWRGQAWIAIGRDRDPSCEPGRQPWVDRTQDVLAFVLPSGPGASFFAGHPFGTHAELELADRRIALLQLNDVAVDVEAVTLTPGAHVRGAIAVAGYGDGPFDAVVCPGQAPVTDALPASPPPDGPVAGVVDGAAFHATVQRAKVHVHPHGTNVEISLFDPAVADPGCDAASWPADGISLAAGGIAAPFAFPGTPQPIVAQRLSRGHGLEQVPGWAIWEDVPTKPGATIRGRIVIASPAGTRDADRIELAGRLAATICP